MKKLLSGPDCDHSPRNLQQLNKNPLPSFFPHNCFNENACAMTYLMQYTKNLLHIFQFFY